MKRILFIFAAGFFLITLCFAQVRTGEINRGIFYQDGIASWYGGEFNGRPTASGEIFNDAQFTAAHPILPFGTMLKITNQHNNKSVTVRVNDRGPFVAARVIDLSRAAAEQLDMIRTGTAPVSIESLSEVSLAQNPPHGSSAQPGQVQSISKAQPWSDDGIITFHPAIPKEFTGKNYRVQVGAYRQPEYAAEAFEKLKKAGLNPAYEKYGDYHRVIIPGIKQEDLKNVSERLGSAGFNEALLREE